MPAQPQISSSSGQQAATRLGVRAPLREVPFVAAPASLPPAWAAHAARQDPTPSPPPSAATPEPVRSSWSDTGAVLVGIGLLLSDAVPELFRPIAFFTRNARVLARAVAYLSVPLAVTAGLYLLVPGMVSAFPVNTLYGLGYLGAMFLASGICTCLALAGLRGIGAGVLALVAAARRRARS